MRKGAWHRIARIVESFRLVWRASPGWMLIGTGIIVLQSLFPPLLLMVLKHIIDITSRGMSGSQHGVFESVAWYIMLAVVIAMAEATVRAIAGLVSEAQRQVVSDYIHGLLIVKSTEVELAYYEDPRYHDTFHRAQEEAPQRLLWLTTNLNQLARSACTLLGILVLLLSFHWFIILLLCACVMPNVLLRMRYAQELHHWHERKTSLERHASYLRSLLTTIEPAKEMRLFGLGGLLRERFGAVRTLLRHENLAIARRRAQTEIAAQLFAEAAIFGCFGFLVFEAIQGRVSLGGLVVYFWALQFGRSLLNETLSSLGSVYENSLFLSSLHEFLRLKVRVLEPKNPVPVPRPLQTGITIAHLSFRYPGSTTLALDDISFDIRPGEKVALVGENGSGKTSLVKLLCRLYDPTAGDIWLDGISLRSFEIMVLRREISVVFQDYMRYELTARENIWFGDIQQPLETPLIETAALRTGVHDLLARLPHGYQTQLGKRFEGGVELSLGEWQKIALARAFMRDSQILILDEPTSALDAEAEYEIFQHFYQLAEGRMAIFISHRLSTVRMADRIYVLDHGRVVESGSHDELMRRQAKYARLFDIQAQPYR